MKNEHVIFFGVGAYANVIWKEISELPYFIDEYIAFTDNNSQLWGTTFKNLKIIMPSELSNDSADIFVISSTYVREIKAQLINETGISESKIYTFEEYKRKCYTRWQYIKKYGYDKGENVRNCFDTNKLVVYTAITGEYDDLRDPLFIDPNIIYVCFTNNSNLKSNIWNMEYLQDNQEVDNMHLAKKIKLHPDLYFKEFETSVWIDGKFQVKDDFRCFIRKYGKDKPMLCFPHYERECIYDEAGACLYFKRGKKEEILRQIMNYYHMGYPVNNGLYEMGCIVRQHNDEKVKHIMNDWEKEINQYSYRDQLSFPVVCKNNLFFPDICDLNLYRNQWVRVYDHNL